MGDQLEKLKDNILDFESGIKSLRDLMKYIKKFDDDGFNTGNCLKALEEQSANTAKALETMLLPVNNKITDLNLKIISFEQMIKEQADSDEDSDEESDKKNKKDKKDKKDKKNKKDKDIFSCKGC